MFMEFVRAIRSQSPHASLCCVGDDWQAINGFAGADSRFFDEFENDFPGWTNPATHDQLPVPPPRRGTAGNAVMAGLGQTRPTLRRSLGVIRIARSTPSNPRPLNTTASPETSGHQRSYD